MNTTRRRFLRDTTAASSAFVLGSRVFGQSGSSTEADAHISIFPGEPVGSIADELYGHFIEHLGGVIYDGVWVGEHSKIANTNGIRTAFLDTMRAIQAPVLRWPGGCFADSYDWRSGEVTYARSTLDFTPGGRELSGEASYGLPVAGGWLSANAYVRHEPGHWRDAPDERGAAMRFGVRF